MQADDKICYCYAISLRKLVNYARRERPVLASQMSECLGAGSGCGWCIPFLKKIWADPDTVDLEETPGQYEERRRRYIMSADRKNEF